MIVISKLTPMLHICMSPVDPYYDGYRFVQLHDVEKYMDGLINFDSGKCFYGEIRDERLSKALEIFCTTYHRDLEYNWNLCRNETSEYRLAQLLRKI